MSEFHRDKVLAALNALSDGLQDATFTSMRLYGG